MSAPDSSCVYVGKPLATGGVLIGDLGITLPSGDEAATMDLDPGFSATGYIAEDGVTQSIGTDSNSIKAWGGSEVRVVQSSHTVSYKFTFLEMNEVTLKALFGDDNVTIIHASDTLGGRAQVMINDKDLPRKSFILEVKDGTAKMRIVLPVSQITSISDVNIVHTDAIKFEVTISCYPDAAGNKAYMYCDDGEVATAATVAS